MIDTTCPYCLRTFGYTPGAKAICLNCGLENTSLPVDVHRPALKAPETAALAPVAERAVMPAPLIRPLSPPKTKTRRKRKEPR